MSAQLWYEPAEIAIAPERSPGTLDCPLVSQPQQRTTPPAMIAQVWPAPAAMAIAAGRSDGTSLCAPQQRTRAAEVSAQLRLFPTEIASALGRSSGTSAWPAPFPPQQRTLPLSIKAHV